MQDRARAGSKRGGLTRSEQLTIFELVERGAWLAESRAALPARDRTTVAKAYKVAKAFYVRRLEDLDDHTCTAIVAEAKYGATEPYVDDLFFAWMSRRAPAERTPEERSPLDIEYLANHRKTVVYFGVRFRDSLVFPPRRGGPWSGSTDIDPTTPGQWEVEQHWAGDATLHPLYSSFRAHLVESPTGLRVLSLTDQVMQVSRDYREAQRTAGETAIAIAAELMAQSKPSEVRRVGIGAVGLATDPAASNLEHAVTRRQHAFRPDSEAFAIAVAERIVESPEIKRIDELREVGASVATEIKALLTPEDIVFKLVRDGECELCSGLTGSARS